MSVTSDTSACTLETGESDQPKRRAMMKHVIDKIYIVYYTLGCYRLIFEIITMKDVSLN